LDTKHIVAIGALAEVQITITVGLEDVSGAKQSRSIFAYNIFKRQITAVERRPTRTEAGL
jgi:hypothetical protein